VGECPMPSMLERDDVASMQSRGTDVVLSSAYRDSWRFALVIADPAEKSTVPAVGTERRK